MVYEPTISPFAFSTVNVRPVQRLVCTLDHLADLQPVGTLIGERHFVVAARLDLDGLGHVLQNVAIRRLDLSHDQRAVLCSVRVMTPLTSVSARSLTISPFALEIEKIAFFSGWRVSSSILRIVSPERLVLEKVTS